MHLLKICSNFEALVMVFDACVNLNYIEIFRRAWDFKYGILKIYSKVRGGAFK